MMTDKKIMQMIKLMLEFAQDNDDIDEPMSITIGGVASVIMARFESEGEPCDLLNSGHTLILTLAHAVDGSKFVYDIEIDNEIKKAMKDN